MMPSPVSNLPVSYDPYVRAGWALVPIPPGTKGPVHTGWNKKENCITNPTHIPADYGIGIAHAYSGTMALDIDDWPHAIIELGRVGVNLSTLYDAPDAVQIISGKEGRAKLLYQMPFGLALPTKRVKTGNKTIYELRCATKEGMTVQDLLPPSIHPETQRPYQWGGRGNWQRLPVIPMELLDHWQNLLNADEHAQTKSLTELPDDLAWGHAKVALTYLSSDCPRDEWISIGMALHYAGHANGQEAEAFDLWNSWSAKSTAKYPGRRELEYQWASFKPDPEGIKLGTLFKLASDRGYRPPAPDIANLFKPIVIDTDKSVFANLFAPPPALDYDLLPPILAARSKEVAEDIGSDPAIAVFAGIAAVCGAADARCRLAVTDSWQVPPLIWSMTIGDPGVKKTAMSNAMSAVLNQIEAERENEYKDAFLLWEAHEAAHAASKKAFNAAAADATAILTGQLDPSVLPKVHELPPKPVKTRLVVTDVTSQKLVTLCADRPRGIVCIMDEMHGWAARVCGMQGSDDRSSWTQSYEAGYYRRDRVGDGDTLIRNYAVAINGNMQPKVFREFLKPLSPDGLLQRFIPVIVRTEEVRLNSPIPEMLTSKPAYDFMIRRIFGSSEQTYRLDTEAYATFRAFQEWFHQVMRDERLLATSSEYMGALAKLEGTCARLILIWQLIENPDQLTIGAELANRAIEFTKTFVLPSIQHCYGEIGGLSEGSMAYWLAEYILQICTEVQTITLSDLKRSARRRLEGLQGHQADRVILDAMSELESHQWTREIPGSRSNSVSWAINPSLATAFPDRRLSIIMARQRQQDRRTQIANTYRRLVRGYTPSIDAG